MTELASLETFARDQLELRIEAAAQQHPRVPFEVLFDPALLHELIALVEECRHLPIQDLSPTVERMLLERCFVDDNGDGANDGDPDTDPCAYLSIILDVLDKVRCEAIESGLFCGRESGNEWFG